MSEMEQSRRRFLSKLGLTTGTLLVTASGLSAQIAEKAEEIKLSPEHRKFMDMYEKWLEEFTDMIRVQKIHPEDMKNNMRLMELTDQSKSWQSQLTEYMTDTNFAKYYLIVTQKVTNEI